MNIQKVEEKIKELEAEKEEIKEIAQKQARKRNFDLISLEEIAEILSQTIKEDKTNKILTFLVELSAFSPDGQLNLSFSAPSSTGKSYIPIQIAKLFPKENVLQLGFASPKSFFHDRTEVDPITNNNVVDLTGKIIIFLDQPHTLLLQHLRPILSHDAKEVAVKIADRNKKGQNRTQNTIIKGWPAVIFCSASSFIDEQEATRFLLLSPEMSQEKIRLAVEQVIAKEKTGDGYDEELEENSKRQELIERINTIKEARFSKIKVSGIELLEEYFDSHSFLKPRDTRDIGKIISIAKTIALLNFPYRKTEEEGVLETKKEDFKEALMLWEKISKAQELNIAPYLLELFNKVLLPLWEENELIQKSDILNSHYKTYGRALNPTKLRKEVIPMLSSAGLVQEEVDPEDKRRVVYRKA